MTLEDPQEAEVEDTVEMTVADMVVVVAAGDTYCACTKRKN